MSRRSSENGSCLFYPIIFTLLSLPLNLVIVTLHNLYCLFRYQMGRCSPGIWILSLHKYFLWTGPSAVSQGLRTPRHLLGPNLTESLLKGMGSLHRLPSGNLQHSALLANSQLIHSPLYCLLGSEEPITQHGSYIPVSSRPPHRLAGLQDPTATLATRKMIESVGKDCLSSSEHRPITWPMLSAALAVIPLKHPVWEATLYRALLSTAFHLCAWVGEVSRSNGSSQHTIRQENTELYPASVQINFRTFKHSRNIKTCSRVLSADHTLLCPVSLLRSYLHIPTGPLFLNKDVSVVTAKLLSHILLTSLQSAGLSTMGITPHSLRIGDATAAASQGALDSQLKLLGRWHSGAYTSYIRPQVVGFRLQSH